MRAEAWRRELSLVRARWAYLVGGTAVTAAATAGLAFLVPAGFARGLVVGALGTAFIALTVIMIMQATGTASTRMGATAEQWTASELRQLRRKGWHLINHYLLGAEIDHLLVGPAGVIVVETKWRRDMWKPSKLAADPRLREALERVSESARSVRLWIGAERNGIPVRPVLFLWQGEPLRPDELPQVGYEVIDGVTIIRGRQSARNWLARVAAADATLTREVIDGIATTARDHLKTRDDREAQQHPLLPSVERLYWIGLGCVLAAAGGISAVTEPLSRGLHWLAFIVAGAALTAGVLARRFERIRLMADAWLAGVGGTSLLAIVVYAIT